MTSRNPHHYSSTFSANPSYSYAWANENERFSRVLHTNADPHPPLSISTHTLQLIQVKSYRVVSGDSAELTNTRQKLGGWWVQQAWLMGLRHLQVRRSAAGGHRASHLVSAGAGRKLGQVGNLQRWRPLQTAVIEPSLARPLVLLLLLLLNMHGKTCLHKVGVRQWRYRWRHRRRKVHPVRDVVAVRRRITGSGSVRGREAGTFHERAVGHRIWNRGVGIHRGGGGGGRRRQCCGKIFFPESEGGTRLRDRFARVANYFRWDRVAAENAAFLLNLRLCTSRTRKKNVVSAPHYFTLMQLTFHKHIPIYRLHISSRNSEVNTNE